MKYYVQGLLYNKEVTAFQRSPSPCPPFHTLGHGNYTEPLAVVMSVGNEPVTLPNCSFPRQ